ncbi:MAG: hypothetical protein AB1796_05950 [Bacillota bacterium]
MDKHMRDLRDLREVIADLKLIKDAVSKSDSIISFMDAEGAVRGILLAGGLLIAAFSAVFHYLLEQYGAFAAIPVNIRAVLFVLIGLAWTGIGYIKARNFLHGARKISADITLYKLMEEIYTTRVLALLLPNIATIILVIIFLGNRGFDLYIIPSLAVLLGLLTVSMSNLFFMKEIFFTGVWLAATGLLTLFIAETINPLATLGITFAAGFILTSLLLYLGSPLKRGRSDEQ